MTNTHFQFAKIVISTGTHEDTLFKFIPCGSNGLTQEEIHQFCVDYHHANEEMRTGDGLKDGFFWRQDDTAVGVFPINRDNPNSMDVPVHPAHHNYMNKIRQYAPELLAI